MSLIVSQATMLTDITLLGQHRRASLIALAAAVLLGACGAPDSRGPTRAAPPPPPAATAPSSPAGATIASPAPTPTPQPTPTGIPAGEGLDPARVTIPAIGVDAEVIDLGLNPDGTMEVPEDFSQTGWFEYGSRPGQQGPAVIAGHIDSTTGPAVFYRLDQLRPGQRITVHSPQGERVTFAVERIGEYPKDAFPTDAVYRFTDEPTLRLVTCGGPFDETIGHYENNVIVFARRVA